MRCEQTLKPDIFFSYFCHFSAVVIRADCPSAASALFNVYGTLCVFVVLWANALTRTKDERLYIIKPSDAGAQVCVYTGA